MDKIIFIPSIESLAIHEKQGNGNNTKYLLIQINSYSWKNGVNSFKPILTLSESP